MASAHLQEHIAQARALAERLPRIVDESRRSARHIRDGLHGNRKVGQGNDFWQFRTYDQGDSFSQIDWRRSARGDKTYIRQNEWQASHTYWIWPMLSPSMYFSSNPRHRQKADCALIIGLAISDLLLRNGETVGAFDTQHTHISNPAQLEKLAYAMLEAPASSYTETPQQIALKQQDSVIIIGDFLDYFLQSEDVSKHHHGSFCTFQTIADMGADTMAFQVLDPAEITPEFNGAIDFTDTDDNIVFRTTRFQNMRQIYQTRFEKWCASIDQLSTRYGWHITRHDTSAAPEPALIRWYASRGSSVAPSQIKRSGMNDPQKDHSSSQEKS